VLAPPRQGCVTDTSLPRSAQEGRAHADDPVLLDTSSLPSAVKKTAVDLGLDIAQVLYMCQPVYMPLRERFQKRSSRSLKTFSQLAKKMVYSGNIEAATHIDFPAGHVEQTQTQLFANVA
tara:strand:- start:145 stop:504 length:360 start_codon:yes stop_codon:yes gene_type:complete